MRPPRPFSRRPNFGADLQVIDPEFSVQSPNLLQNSLSYPLSDTVLTSLGPALRPVEPCRRHRLLLPACRRAPKWSTPAAPRRRQPSKTFHSLSMFRHRRSRSSGAPQTPSPSPKRASTSRCTARPLPRSMARMMSRSTSLCMRSSKKRAVPSM